MSRFHCALVFALILSTPRLAEAQRRFLDLDKTYNLSTSSSLPLDGAGVASELSRGARVGSRVCVAWFEETEVKARVRVDGESWTPVTSIQGDYPPDDRFAPVVLGRDDGLLVILWLSGEHVLIVHVEGEPLGFSEPSVVFSAPALYSLDAKLSANRLHVISRGTFEGSLRVIHARSDDGRAFATQWIGEGNAHYPAIAVRDERVAIVFLRRDAEPNVHHVQFVRSANDGESFDFEATAIPNVRIYESLLVPAFGTGGRLHVVGLEGDQSPTIHYAHDDGDGVFGPTLQLRGTTSATTDRGIHLDVNGDDVRLFWADANSAWYDPSGKPEIVCRRSFDGGVTWVPPVGEAAMNLSASAGLHCRDLDVATYGDRTVVTWAVLESSGFYPVLGNYLRIFENDPEPPAGEPVTLPLGTSTPPSDHWPYGAAFDRFLDGDIVGGTDGAPYRLEALEEVYGDVWFSAQELDDCDANGEFDVIDLRVGAVDCNGNRILDACELSAENDVDGNGVLDVCEPDCNRNEIPDAADIAAGRSLDVDADAIPDECQSQVPECPLDSNLSFDAQTFSEGAHLSEMGIAVDGDLVVAAWTENFRIIATRSTDGGLSFDPPQPIAPAEFLNRSVGDPGLRPRIAIVRPESSDDDRVVCISGSARESSSAQRPCSLWITASVDAGASWPDTPRVLRDAALWSFTEGELFSRGRSVYFFFGSSTWLTRVDDITQPDWAIDRLWVPRTFTGALPAQFHVGADSLDLVSILEEHRLIHSRVRLDTDTLEHEESVGVGTLDWVPGTSTPVHRLFHPAVTVVDGRRFAVWTDRLNSQMQCRAGYVGDGSIAGAVDSFETRDGRRSLDMVTDGEVTYVVYSANAPTVNDANRVFLEAYRHRPDVPGRPPELEGPYTIVELAFAGWNQVVAKDGVGVLRYNVGVPTSFTPIRVFADRGSQLVFAPPLDQPSWEPGVRITDWTIDRGTLHAGGVDSAGRPWYGRLQLPAGSAASEDSDLVLEGVSPKTIDVEVPTTLSIYGKGLETARSLRLEPSDCDAPVALEVANLVASERVDTDPAEVFSSGSYDLVAINRDGREVRLNNAVTAIASCDQRVRVDVTIAALMRFRTDQRFHMRIETDCPGPVALKVVSSRTGALLWLAGEEDLAASELVILCEGGECDVPFFYRAECSAGTSCDNRLSVHVFEKRSRDVIRAEDISELSPLIAEAVLRSERWRDFYLNTLPEYAALNGRRGLSPRSGTRAFRDLAWEALGGGLGIVTGRVLADSMPDSSGVVGLEGEEVVLERDGVAVRTTLSGTNGLWGFGRLPAGEYSACSSDRRVGFTVDWGDGPGASGGGELHGVDLEPGTSNGAECLPGESVLPGDPDAGDLPLYVPSAPERFWSLVFDTDVQVRGSVDPNDKEGSSGEGDDALLGGGARLAYTIRCENLAEDPQDPSFVPSAAEHVVIEDRLDPEEFDLDCFEFHEVRIAERVDQSFDFSHPTYDFPSGNTLFEDLGTESAATTIPIRHRDETGAIVDEMDVSVVVSLDRDSGLARWELTDPVQFDNQGFLLPEDGLDQGKLTVTFSVRPRGEFAPGVCLTRKNKATILFDQNDPIPTEETSDRVGDCPILDEVSVVALPRPRDGATEVLPNEIVLQWRTPGRRLYDVRLGSDLSSPVVEVEGISDSFLRVPSDLLEPGVEYFWQVVPHLGDEYLCDGGDSADCDDCCAVFSFTTAERAESPPEPSEPSPPSGATVDAASAVLRWNASVNAEGYSVYLWLQGEEIPDEPIAGALQTTELSLAGRLEVGADYEWSVVALGATRELDTAGPVWSFRTKEGNLFRRADINADGAVDLSDGVFLLNFLFLGGRNPPCLDAADANDDGVPDISDAVYVLNWLFVSGSPPPPPRENCGGDRSGASLGCESFPPCE